MSDIFEAAEKRKDARVYREIEFSLPRELTKEQNIAWAREFVYDNCVAKGMLAIMNFHFDFDKKTGEEKPHCHVLLSTRELTETGLSPHKQTDWDRVELVEEWREQYAQYQNAALKTHGFEERVDHRSYVDQGLEIDPQPKRGRSIAEMTDRGIHREKAERFDIVRLRNQFRILKNPELVFSIVTAKHSTFTRQDIAKVLNRYIDEADQFRILHDRLMGSKELIDLQSSSGQGESKEPVYTTREMLRTELSLMRTAEAMTAQQTHKVDAKIIDNVIANQNAKLAKYGGLSTDQVAAIRHVLRDDQVSCVVGFAGAGKTTALEAAKEGWEKAGYTVIGLAPTGKAARNIEDSGIRSMTLHKFLKAQSQGRERITDKTVLVLDEAGVVDSRRMSEVITLAEKMGAKSVYMGDGNQLQAVEAGPAFRLLIERVKPAVLEKIVRHNVEWQREATRLFGSLQSNKALTLYQENGCFHTIKETRPNIQEKEHLVDNFCLARQMSGRIWKEMMEDCKDKLPGKSFDRETDFGIVTNHPDFKLFLTWKGIRQELVEKIVEDFEVQKPTLAEKGIDMQRFENVVAAYQADGGKNAEALKAIEAHLRKMSYDHIVDTRSDTKQALVEAWVQDRKDSPNQSHIMLAFTNKDALSLNESARALMRVHGEITGPDYQFVTQHIETDDFGDEIKTSHNRQFAKGDRLLFTRNDNSLKVKNGTLGRILSIAQNKITVALDGKGKDKRTVSFSPNLYPFIDNGWATTIYKAQGTTVDHVKLLASFEQYRNMAYVGMSRHRQSLKVFASDLDFWREEKIIDRLSRVQEKLSGFDYLSGDKVEELMKQDTEILWHKHKIQEGKDLWTAIKVTTKDVLGQTLSRSPEGRDGFISFESSEEKRSVDFFKAPDQDIPKEFIGKQYSEQEAEVLSYLRQEIRPEKHAWMKESYGQTLLEAAEKNPVEALARWQKVSGDYTFQSSTPNSLITPQHREIIDPILASEKLIELSEKQCNNLSDIAVTHSNKAFHKQQREARLEFAVQEFISLSERYATTSWDDPERNKVQKELDSIAKAYLKNEKFQQKIEDSQSDAAIQKLNEEIQMRKRQLSRGMSHCL